MKGYTNRYCQQVEKLAVSVIRFQNPRIVELLFLTGLFTNVLIYGIMNRHKK